MSDYSDITKSVAQAETSSKSTRTGKPTLHVCPFCGTINNDDRKPCARCTLEDSPTMRAATKARIGPWYVLQTRNPAAPGMRFQTLGVLIRKGLVTPQSVVRGPTTHQLWQWAAKVKGLSREFALCYSCGETIEKTDTICDSCNRSQLPPDDVDGLLDATVPAPATGAPEDKSTPSQTADPLAPDALGSPEQDDILSARELAMVFQLDYGPPIPTSEVPVRHYRTKVAVAAVLLAIAAIGVFIWSFRETHPKNRGATVVLVTAPPSVIVERHHPELVALGATTQPTTTPAITPASAPVQATPAFDVRGTWDKALDAEGHQDFATAFKLYQEIAKQPRTVWPAGLQTRLKLARQETTIGTK